MSEETPTSSVRTLDDLTRVVLAPNASPMTLEGTNTYLLGDRSSGSLLVVDPGPDDAAHLERVESAIDGADVAAVIITHHHHDHAEAAGWADRWGAPLRAFDPGLIPGARTMVDGETLSVAGIDLSALHTPGHASDHLCLRIHQTDVVLTGDHVLGRGSTIVNWPDGDMTAYMASLRRLAGAPGARIYPGHGPMVDRPAEKIAEYLAHRVDREAQIRAAIDDGADSPQAIVRAVYTDVPEILHPAAERSVRAVLAMLIDRGQVDPALMQEVAGPVEPSTLATDAPTGEGPDDDEGQR
ncbi:MBL fold metallo-hydrolase [Euzebya rosea]|uniref:MBL fold metallo-hydrolase n=1 Tax=Euzebya rosea TaxID=2052804 RepID=UPI00196A1FD7|nr:MBL fold metallo-hydrolase [Euzebya rosea]